MTWFCQIEITNVRLETVASVIVKYSELWTWFECCWKPDNILAYMTKKCTRSINEPKRKISIQYWSDTEPLYDISSPFIAHLWLIASIRWIGVVRSSEPHHLGEPVRTHITRSFISRVVYYFIEPSEVAVWFLIRLRSEPISLM